jgi:hypothetical protein
LLNERKKNGKKKFIKKRRIKMEILKEKKKTVRE